MELVAVERRGVVEAQLAVGEAKAPAEQVGVVALAAHALAEAAVVVTAAAAIAQTVHHMLRLERDMRAQPILKQFVHLQRQAQQHIAAIERTGFAHSRHDVFQLVIGEYRDQRGDEYGDRNPRLAQAADGFQAPLRCGGARFEQAGQGAIQGGERYGHVGQVAPRQGRQQVDVALDEGRFGDHAEGMGKLAQHLDEGAGQAEAALHRLVGIGIDAEGNGGAAVAGPGQFLPQQCRGVRLVKQAALEVQPRRQAEPGVAGAGETIHTAVLTAAVGIEGAVEGDVGRVVVIDHRATAVHQQFGVQRFRLFQAAPAVVHRYAAVFRIAVVRAAGGTAAAEG